LREAAQRPLLHFNASDFNAAAFDALKSVDIALGVFGLDTEEAQFELAFRTHQQGLYELLHGCHRMFPGFMARKRLLVLAVAKALNRSAWRRSAAR
jgi:hypothetical protein